MLLNFITAAVFLVLGMTVLLLGRRVRSSEAGLASGKMTLDELYGPAGPLTRAFAGAMPFGKRLKEGLSRDLVRAGYFRTSAADRFLGTRNAAVMAWVIFALVVLVTLSDRHRLYERKLIWLAIGGGIMIFGLPRLIVTAQANARSRRIEKSLPDAIDMITMTMAGGVPMRDAMRHVRDEVGDSHPDLACELKIIEKQADTGTLAHALDRFAERVDLPDVTGLAALMKQNDRLGGQVVDTMRDYADDVRRKRRQMAEEQGNKASIKLLLPVVFCLAPPIYILLLGPAVMELRSFITTENQAGGVLSQQVSAGPSQRNGSRTGGTRSSASGPQPAFSSNPDVNQARGGGQLSQPR